MTNATISADIIASTSLSDEDIKNLTNQIIEVINVLEKKHGVKGDLFFGRLIKGDYVECYMQNPQNALRIALILKSLVKSFPLSHGKSGNRTSKNNQLFQNYGIRLAIGVGKMNTVTGKNEIWKGEAISLSGRRIDEQKTSNKDKIIIKNTMFFAATNTETTAIFSCFVGLLDKIINDATSKQCEVLHWKLLDKSEIEIAKLLHISQSAVNQHSTAIGWNAINNAILFYEQYKY